jgi:hypothetical protein
LSSVPRQSNHQWSGPPPKSARRPNPTRLGQFWHHLENDNRLTELSTHGSIKFIRPTEHPLSNLLTMRDVG